MNKGLQALKKIKKGGREDDDFGWLSNSYLYEEEIATIEKELKQAQEDKKVLNIFKNALAIKQTCVFPKEQDHSKDDTFVYACRYLYEITQNDLDEKLRKSLREWVLKNAFPEEVKALNEILALHDKWLGYKMSDFEFFTLLSEARDKYDLSKEVLEK